MGGTRLALNCDDVSLKLEVKGAIETLMAGSEELQARGSQAYAVEITGACSPKPKDLAREVAETVLFECGNLMHANDFRQMENSLVTSSVQKTGLGMSTIEAKQMYEWGLALIHCRNSCGIRLSGYGSDQADIIEKAAGNQGDFVWDFNFSSHGLGKTSVDAGFDRKNSKISIVIHPPEHEPEAEPPRSSKEMYAYNLLKDVRWARLRNLIQSLVGDPSYRSMAGKLINVDPKPGEMITMYCSMLNVIDRVSGWMLAKPARDVALTPRMKRYAIWDPAVANTLDPNTRSKIQEELYENLDLLPALEARRAKQCFGTCPFY